MLAPRARRGVVRIAEQTTPEACRMQAFIMQCDHMVDSASTPTVVRCRHHRCRRRARARVCIGACTFACMPCVAHRLPPVQVLRASELAGAVVAWTAPPALAALGPACRALESAATEALAEHTGACTLELRRYVGQRFGCGWACAAKPYAFLSAALT